MDSLAHFHEDYDTVVVVVVVVGMAIGIGAGSIVSAYQLDSGTGFGNLDASVVGERGGCGGRAFAVVVVTLCELVVGTDAAGAG